MSPKSRTQWIKTVALLVIALGAVMAAGAAPALSEPVRLLLDLIFWPLDGAETVDRPVDRLLLAIVGGLSVGFGVLVYRLTGLLEAPNGAALADAIVWGVAAWFCIDSLGSVVAGAPVNLVPNGLVLAGIVGPIFLGRRRPA